MQFMYLYIYYCYKNNKNKKSKIIIFITIKIFMIFVVFIKSRKKVEYFNFIKHKFEIKFDCNSLLKFEFKYYIDFESTKFEPIISESINHDQYLVLSVLNFAFKLNFLNSVLHFSHN